MGLDASSKIDRFRKHSPSAMPPKSSSASDRKKESKDSPSAALKSSGASNAMRESKDSPAQSPPTQPIGGKKHPNDSAPLGLPQRPLPDPNDHRMSYGVPQTVFSHQNVPAQQQHVRGQPVSSSGLSDSAVIANLQATVQRQEFQIQALYQGYRHLSVDMTFVKNAAHNQIAQSASVQSQLRALHTRSAQAQDQKARLDNIESQLKALQEQFDDVDDEFVYPASHMRQLLDEMEKAVVTASNVGTSTAPRSPGQLSGREVDDAMSEYSQSETDGRSHVGYGTHSTEGSPDDANQSTHPRMEMDQVSETASDNDQLVD